MIGEQDKIFLFTAEVSSWCQNLKTGFKAKLRVKWVFSAKYLVEMGSQSWKIRRFTVDFLKEGFSLKLFQS